MMNKKVDYRYVAIVLAMIGIISTILVLLFSCEKQVEDSGCWRCIVKTTIEYENEPHKREIVDYYNSCDSLFQPRLFEEMNTWDWDTISGLKMKRESICTPLECW